MGKSKSSSVPSYPTTTTDTGLFGTATTNKKGSTFKPTDFQTQLVGVTENNAISALNNYLNPDYESEDYKRGDEYYTSQMQNKLQNDYLNPALSRNLLRGSTAQDAMRGFANDLANTEYERQKDYQDQQLNKYMAAMMPYTTMYDMMSGTEGLSQALTNSIANYQLGQYDRQQANSKSGGSGIGGILGGLGSMFSDIRLKENIKKIDEVEGINIYKFDFIEGSKDQIGVIAQEVDQKYPYCVSEVGGYLKVDYSKLPQKVQDKIKELRGE